MNRNTFVVVTVACALVIAACGGDSEGDLDLADRLTQQAGGASATLPATPTAVIAAATAASPTLAPVNTTVPSASPDAATVLQVRTLGTFVLTEQDLPAGFVVENSQAAFRAAVIAAQQGVLPLAEYLSASSLRGSWATLFIQAGPPPIAQSSIIYLFAEASDASGFVAANGALDASDYLGATAIEPLPSPDVGDVSALIRVTTADGGSLELTWAQGPMAGQLILRYSGDDEPDDAVDRITGFAQIQAERMTSFLPR